MRSLIVPIVSACLAMLAVLAGCRRALRPILQVSQVNGVWVLRVTSAVASRQYVRVETLPRVLPFLCIDSHRPWLNVRTGDELRSRYAMQAERLVELELAMRRLREEVPS
jgi:hypothetical protein